MEANKILSAPLIDLIFDGRNKNYGAYELRKTNSRRTRTALSVTISIVALIMSLVTMANGSKKRISLHDDKEGVKITQVVEPPPEDIPEPERQPEPEPPVETVQFTPPEIVPDDQAQNLMTDIASLDSAEIGTENIQGEPPSGETPPKAIDKETGIVQPKENTEPEGILTIVEVPAKFKDNWPRFLLKNLDPETPVNNGAEPGRYSVVIQFVVDKEGNVSDITPLTNHGHGMEQEAVRVLKKSPQWEPAIQNGHKVKAYHKQVIVFEVNPEE